MFSAVAGDALKGAGKSLTVSASPGQLLAVGAGLNATKIPDGTAMVLTFKPTDALVTAGKTSVSCGNVQLSDKKGTGFAGAGGTGQSLPGWLLRPAQENRGTVS